MNKIGDSEKKDKFMQFMQGMLFDNIREELEFYSAKTKLRLLKQVHTLRKETTKQEDLRLITDILKLIEEKRAPDQDFF